MVGSPSPLVADIQSINRAGSSLTTARFGLDNWVHLLINNLTTSPSTFVPHGAEIRMIVRIDPHLDEVWTQRSVEGFTSQLTKLPGALERRRGARSR